MNSTKFLLRSFGVFLALAQLASAASAPFPLWSGAAPGEKGDIPKEETVTDDAKPSTTRVSNVSQPTLTVYSPVSGKNTGVAVLVCPGGGYGKLAWDKEGTEIAEWLNSIGVTGVVLKYRVPKRPGLEKHAAPLQDAQRAMGLIRQHAKEWNIDPKRVGVLGFSAGGHLGAVLSNNYDQRTYPAADAADQLSCRPDFAVLIYPAYLTVKEQGDKIAPELPITSKTPPSLLIQTQDDGVRVESSVFYYLALKNAKVPVEMHLYPKGGHGYGMRASADTVSSWPKRAEEWMRASGYLGKR